MSGATGEAMPRSLEEQRAEFARQRFLAMPVAGLIAWSVGGISGFTLPPTPAVWLYAPLNRAVHTLEQERNNSDDESDDNREAEANPTPTSRARLISHRV
jgi:hypothetical protein